MQTYDQGLNTRTVKCIGCHTSTPDGSYIAFNDFYPWGAVLASGTSPAGVAPPTSILGVGRRRRDHPAVGRHHHLLEGPLDRAATTSWSRRSGPAERRSRAAAATAMDMDQQSGLAWFDLESAATVDINNARDQPASGTAWNWIYAPATGLYAAAPSFSHDGTQVLFTMTDKVKSGRLGTSANTHLYTVPYSKTAPQAAMPVPGDGSAAGSVQYYGALSGDDKMHRLQRAGRDVTATTSTRRWIRWTSTPA